MLSGNPSGDMDEKLTRPSSDSKRLVVRQSNTGAVAGLNGYDNALWPSLIAKHAPNETDAVSRFYELVDEFYRLRS